MVIDMNDYLRESLSYFGLYRKMFRIKKKYDFAEMAKKLGNSCELYCVQDKRNTHSWYTAGMFMEKRKENKGLDKFFSWIEER